jgi:hypothetical protein
VKHLDFENLDALDVDAAELVVRNENSQDSLLVAGYSRNQIAQHAHARTLHHEPAATLTVTVRRASIGLQTFVPHNQNRRCSFNV